MTSYSQYGEDSAIAKAVAGIEKGRLLDLGAWQPKTFSNSRALIEQGWTGLLVECSPGPARDLIREYSEWPGVEVIVAAVALDRTCIQIHATDDAVSTADEGVHALWSKDGGYYGKFWAPTIRLEDISNQFGGGFDFINFDTEGLSVPLFFHALELEWDPRCVCLEHDGRIVEVVQRAEKHGYKVVHLNGTNVVFSK